ncbi:MAG: DUF6293 family protein [Candidatus Methanoperedens sp.]|nr:DUF6293 family protein [Candidatus Methanoperedens sp.]
MSNVTNVTNQIMELTGQKKVHIVPMDFEIDRIEIPLRDIGADRVYLITDLKESETVIVSGSFQFSR